MGDFHFDFALPIMGIDSLNKLLEVGKHSGLVMVDQSFLIHFVRPLYTCQRGAAWPHHTHAASCMNLMKYFIAWWFSCI